MHEQHLQFWNDARDTIKVIADALRESGMEAADHLGANGRTPIVVRSRYLIDAENELVRSVEHAYWAAPSYDTRDTLVKLALEFRAERLTLCYSVSNRAWSLSYHEPLPEIDEAPPLRDFARRFMKVTVHGISKGHCVLNEVRDNRIDVDANRAAEIIKAMVAFAHERRAAANR